MSVKFSQLLCKEVICLCSGQRLGFVSDVRVELPEGRITAIVVPGKGRCLGLLGSKEDFEIPWKSVVRIGPDILLVDVRPEECRVPRIKHKLPF